jgi:hypothetical protein
MSAGATAGLPQPGNAAEEWHPRFGLVLMLICATFVFISAAPSKEWTILVTLGLVCATLLAAARTAHLGNIRPLWIAAFALTLLIAGLIALFAPDETTAGSDARGVAFILMAVMIALVAPIIVTGVIHDLRSRGAAV